MASAPKRRRVRKSHQQANSTTQPNQTDDISQLVETCMAAAMPIVQETVRQCILNSRQNDTSQEAATSDPGISTLVDITSAALPLEEQESHSNPHCAEQQRNNNGSTSRQDEKSLQILFKF